MSSVLIINGTSYNQSARKTHSLLVDGWGWDLDADRWLEFSEYCAGPQPQISGPVPVTLTVGGTTVFTGDLISAEPTFGAWGRTWGYRCLGLAYRANWIPVTAVDGSGVILFNVSPTDTDNYLPSFAGQSVGQILSYCLTQHASALSGVGITTDSTTTSQLAALTITPNEQVEVAGERLWSAMQSVLQRWARNNRIIIAPTGTGTGVVRIVDITTGTSHTLTAGTDPIEPPLFSRNWVNNATAVTVRGKGVIEPAYLTLSHGDLTAAWSGTAQTNWTFADFTNPSGATDNGTVTTVNGPTQVTVQSANGSLTWATNYWAGLQAWVYLTKSSGSGLTYQEARPITANGALTAGGTTTLTLGYALSNTASNAYDTYKIIGTNVPLASGGRADVWRLYNITDPGSYVAQHLVRNFPTEVPFIDYFGTVAVLTTTPTCQIIKSGTAGPALFTVDPAHGQILFTRPVVEQLTTQANLALGGSHVTAPDDIYMLLAYSRGALTTTYPTSGYSGTAYSAAGLQRTQWVDVESWRYGGNTSLMGGLAQMLQASVRDTQMEGMVTYKGYYATVQDPTAGSPVGHLMNFAGAGYTTGDESLNIPLRAVSYRYWNEAGGGVNYTTSLRCSTRRDPRTGESMYTHLSQLGSGIQLQSYGQAGGNFQFAGSILPEAQAEDLSAFAPNFGADESRAIGRGQAREAGALADMTSDEARAASAGTGTGQGRYRDAARQRAYRDRLRRDQRIFDENIGFAMPGQANAPPPAAPAQPVPDMHLQPIGGGDNVGPVNAAPGPKAPDRLLSTIDQTAPPDTPPVTIPPRPLEKPDNKPLARGPGIVPRVEGGGVVNLNFDERSEQ